MEEVHTSETLRTLPTILPVQRLKRRININDKCIKIETYLQLLYIAKN
jgi:hypothetical protein